MIAELGAFALTLALAFSIAQVGLSVAARLRRSTVLAAAGEGAALAAFAGVALAFAALVHAFVTSDFSVANVAANSHTEKPLLYRVAGAWGSHEGSMLLWCLALTGYGAAAAVFGRNLPRSLKSLMVATQGGLGMVFLAYTVFASNPLARIVNPPVEGRSLNPLLQDPALAVHPPFLYAGYVGMSVVFSLAVAALIEGRVDAAWARWIRPWALFAWSLLTVGITLGSFWAYYELGWGGWWFWDPVENASFMPWLVAAALLHSAIVTEKRGDAVGVAQRLWAAALIALAAGLLAFALVSPRQAFGAAGLAIGAWLIAGAVAEVLERTRAFRIPAAESWRRLAGLPRGAWGMTLAHLGLGVFVLGACFETGWKAEAAETLPLGGALDVGGYHLVLENVGPHDGPNYDAERALIRATRNGQPVCTPQPERRFFPAGGQTTSEVAICYRGLSHLYVVLGERREAAGQPVWLVRAYWNPWATLIFIGPVIMGLGGLISLSDRRLRLGVARRREQPA
jgi:cytochrome c biogenesis factor